MNLKISELSEQITPTLHQKGRDRWYTASCPWCPSNESVDVRSSDTIAKTLVVGKVISHVRIVHKDMIQDEEADK